MSKLRVACIQTNSKPDPNINIEEVTTALSGVFTGETESLKRLGIVMTEVNLKQFAMEQGIKKNIKEMTQAEKVALRFQYVLSVTGNAQGDFARTGGGAANQMRTRGVQADIRADMLGVSASNMFATASTVSPFLNMTSTLMSAVGDFSKNDGYGLIDLG